jgi:hypothetical protein
MRDDRRMRTTLDLDADILQAAKELARTRGLTTGQIVSELVRKALHPSRAARLRNGVPVLSSRKGAPKLTMRDVNALRDEP